MAFTDQIGQAQTGRAATLANIQLGIGAQPNPSVNASLFTAVAQNRFATAKVVQRATSQLITDPPNFDMATSETFPYAVDTTAYLGVNDSVSSVSAVLTFLFTGKTVTSAWQGTIVVSRNIVTVPIQCNVLNFGQQYQIAVTFQGNSTKIGTYTSNFRLVA